MKKRILALLMALVMVFGLNTTFLAAGSATVDNEVEVQELKVEWVESIPWAINIPAVDDGTGYHDIYVEVYKDGKWVDYIMFAGNYPNGIVPNISSIVGENGAGEYTVEVCVYSESTDWELTYLGETTAKKYVEPSTKLATPTNLNIAEDGTLTFDAVDGAISHRVYLCWEYPDRPYDISWGEVSADGKQCSVDMSFALDIVEVMKEEDNDVKFSIGVRAVSENVDTVAWSDMAQILLFEKKLTTAEVKNNVYEALKNDDSWYVKSALANVSNDTILELLNTDAEFAAKIKEAETKYMDEYNVKVQASSSVQGIDQSKISISGAAFSGWEDAIVTLAVTEPSAEALSKLSVPDTYTNRVALDIELFVKDTNASTDAEVVEYLACPVTITMPIPTGVSAENLVILHYHEEGKDPQIIKPVVNADGTMTFTVTGFSTFVVANEVPATASPKTADVAGVTTVCAIMLIAAAAVVIMKKRTVVK